MAGGVAAVDANHDRSDLDAPLAPGSWVSDPPLRIIPHAEIPLSRPVLPGCPVREHLFKTACQQPVALSVTNPAVCTLILNFNRRADTLACLASLHAEPVEGNQIIVLDVASTDGSVDAIRAAYPALEVIPLHENRGYAGNNNVGISVALERGAEWVFVLNEDTVLAPDCLRRLLAAGRADPRIGVVGPKVLHADDPHVIQSAGGQLDRHWEPSHAGMNEMDAGQWDTPRRVPHISGCAILVRTEAIRRAGMLDEEFFCYWEETEWCIRLDRAGYSAWVEPAARLWHKGVQRNYQPSPAVVYYFTRNRLLALSKLRAPLTVRAFAQLQTVRTIASYTLRPKWRHKGADLRAMRRGLADFWAGHLGKGTW